VKIREDTIQEIKSQIDIVDVISDFVNLKKSGSNYKALSPFTNEKTPSFFVSPSKEIYKCFSSGKGGNAINFIMEIEGINYVEALQYLAKKYGIEIRETKETEEEIRVHNERESLFIVLTYARDYYVKNLWESPQGQSIGLSYFRERGFDDLIIKKFELGYSHDSWDAFYQNAIEQKHEAEILDKAGLILRKENKIYDRFRGRVLFPIHNLTGKPIAFGARILVGDKNQPKYINSPETPVYHKSRTLYGIFQGRQAIRQKDNCYLVEGYTDVISMHCAGVENVVASSGTSLTEGQINIIKRYTNNITVLFDGDEAGISASLRGIDMILESGLNVRAVMFPEGEDPDSYARKTGQAGFKEYLIGHTKDFISFKAALLAREARQDPIAKAKTIREIVASISKIPDGVQRAVYLKETGRLLSIDESVLIAELNKILIEERKRRKTETREPDISLIEKTAEEAPDLRNFTNESIRLQEKESIRLLINYGLNEIEEELLLYEFILSELEDVEFQTPVYRSIFETFKENLRNGQVLDAEYFLKNGPDEVRKEVVDMVANPYEVSINWENKRIYVPTEKELLNKSVFDNIVRLKYRFVSRLIEDNIQEIKDGNQPDEIDRLLKINMELKKIKSELGRKLGIVVAN
jgi:DNA primase